MAHITRPPAAPRPAVQLLAGFVPVAELWQSGVYPSEQSARWALRVHRAELLAAGAIAQHRGRVYVHLARFAQVIERAAVARARARHPIAGAA